MGNPMMRSEHVAMNEEIEHFREDWMREFPGGADQNIKFEIMQALFKGNERSIRFLCFLVSDFILRDEPLTDDLKMFTHIYLQWHLLYPDTVFQIKDGDLVTVPRKTNKKRGRRSDAHDTRNKVITLAMYMIAKEWGFPLTRNDGSEHASAASIVKEALETEKILFLGEKSINKTWEGRDRDHNYDSPAARID